MRFKAGSAHARDFSGEFVNQPMGEIEGHTAVADTVGVCTAKAISLLTE
jgi:hypothetical protein